MDEVPSAGLRERFRDGQARELHAPREDGTEVEAQIVSNPIRVEGGLLVLSWILVVDARKAVDRPFGVRRLLVKPVSGRTLGQAVGDVLSEP
jgi:hypothetical protein